MRLDEQGLDADGVDNGLTVSVIPCGRHVQCYVQLCTPQLPGGIIVCNRWKRKRSLNAAHLRNVARFVVQLPQWAVRTRIPCGVDFCEGMVPSTPTTMAFTAVPLLTGEKLYVTFTGNDQAEVQRARGTLRSRFLWRGPTPHSRCGRLGGSQCQAPTRWGACGSLSRVWSGCIVRAGDERVIVARAAEAAVRG